MRRKGLAVPKGSLTQPVLKSDIDAAGLRQDETVYRFRTSVIPLTGPYQALFLIWKTIYIVRDVDLIPGSSDEPEDQPALAGLIPI